MGNEQDIEQIKDDHRDHEPAVPGKDGAVVFAGIDGGIVKIAPAGYCWR